ncbi:MAG: hypothetical protein HUU10_12635 [Bacteroidetes bacterium]|nr:hypothetical protein [Bacteroidota bacterium]
MSWLFVLLIVPILLRAQFVTTEFSGGLAGVSFTGQVSHFQGSIRYDINPDWLLSATFLKWTGNDSRLSDKIVANRDYFNHHAYNLEISFHDRFNRYSGLITGGGLALAEMKRGLEDGTLETRLIPGFSLSSSVYVALLSRVYLTGGVRLMAPLGYRGRVVSVPRWGFVNAGVGFLLF